MKEAGKTLKVLVGDLSSPTTPNTFCAHADLGDRGSLLNLSFAQTVLPSLLILCGDVESNPGPETQLKVDDHFKVTQCLKDLLLKDLKSLGEALGLRYTTLDRMTSDSLCEGLVLAWLNQQDNVMKESGKPTWESLMRALRTIGHGELAQQIAQDQLKTQYHESAASTVSSCASSVLSVVELVPHFPFLPIHGMSEDEKKIKMSRLYQDTEQMKTRFVNLIFGLQKSVRKSYTFDDFLSLLKFHDMNFEEKLLEGCNTMTEVFRRVSRFCSFHDHHIIKLWIKKFGGRKNKEALKSFKQKIQEYSKRRVCECPSNAFGNSEKSEKVLSLKCEIELDKMTIEEFGKLEKRMKIALGGPVLRLLRIDKGYKMKYRTLDDNIIDDITEEQQLALQSLGFMSISYADQSLNLSSQEITTDDKGKDQVQPFPPRKRHKGDDDADSAFGAVSDITGTGIATHSDDVGSIFTSGLRTYISDEFQDYVGRDLKDPRLDMIVSAETTTKQSLELHRAAEIGDLEEVKRLITKGLNPLTKDANNNAPVHEAAFYGELEVLEHLIENELCNPAASGQYGMTPLHQAAEAGHLNIVQYLVEKHQVDPLEQDEAGASPLHRACGGGNFKVVKYLMETMLTFMKMEDIFKDFTKYQTSPVHIAAQFGHIETLKYFIHDCNCDPNLPSGVHGGGPLFDAAQWGHLSIVKFLIMECGCDPESRNDNHATPLGLAAQFGHLSIVQYLCEDMRCDPLCRSKRNSTPLHYAALRGHSDVCDYLINIMQCNPNVPGQYGRRPLHHASQEGHLHLVKNLIENHACDPNSLDDRNSTPLHIAAMNGHLSIIRYLTEVKGCNAMLQDKDLGTPLYWAAKYGQLATIKYFIEHLHCSPNIRNMFNKTPLQLAQAEGHSEVVDYFHSHC